MTRSRKPLQKLLYIAYPRMFWRISTATKVYELCNQIALPDGLLISHDFDQPVQYIKKALFQQKCFEGTTPMLNTNVKLVMKKFLVPLPIVKSSWEEFTLPPNRGVFVYSVVPIVYSISILAVITWFLTLFVMSNYTIKPSSLLKISTFLSLVYMLITVIRTIVALHDQQRQGYLHGQAVVEVLNGSLYLNIIDLIVTLFLQVNQVQVVMRLFSRQKDKRLIFFIGVLALIASQSLWGVSKFHNFLDEAEAGKILPAFTYLIRIAIGMCYAAIFTAFILTKIKIAFANKSIWLITLLTVILIYAPVAFFIADVSSTWAYELSEVFSVATYVICVVIPWEWCNKYNHIRKIIEKEGVLGRRFHEDELYELDRFELFVEDESIDSESGSGSASGSGGSTNENSSSNHTKVGVAEKHEEEVVPSTFNRLTTGLWNAREMFLDITDKIIATGLAIPRSVSIGSNTTPQNVNFDNPVPEFQPARSEERNVTFAETGTARHRRDVFVYSTRDVVVGMDE